MTAALGIRVHSGWAALVAVAGTIDDPKILLRRRITLIEGNIPAQPYHAVENAGTERARKLLAKWRAQVNALALREIHAAIAAIPEYRVVEIALLMAWVRELPSLERILAAHPLIHTAEGQFYRAAVKDAARRLRLRLVGVPEKLALVHAWAVLRRCKYPTEEDVQQRLNELRAEVGPPWTQDQKLATLAALTALSLRRAKIDAAAEKERRAKLRIM